MSPAPDRGNIFQVIVVADPSQSDSTTVILRSTTVIAYRPDMPDRPFSCNLNNAEVFSCVLGSEEDSALSIIDPVTINFEIGDRNQGVSKGLVDLAEETEQRSRTAEIQLQQLNVRLSYYDWLMFQAIMESFPRQAKQGDKNCVKPKGTVLIQVMLLLRLVCLVVHWC